MKWFQRLTRLALVFALALSITGGLAAAASADDALPTATFTVVPGHVVTDQVRVELRLAVTNPGEQVQDLQVEFGWRSAGAEVPIATESVAVGVGETELVSAWWATNGRVGTGEIHYRVTAGEENVAQGSWPLEIVHSDTPALPLLTGAWIEPGAYIDGVYPGERPIEESDVRADLDAMHRAGMDTVIVAYTEFVLNGWGAFYPTQHADMAPNPVPFDLVDVVLDQAEQNGQHVYMGLGRGHDLYLTYTGFNDPERVAAGLEWSQRLATELWERYGDSPAFYGWYLTHEVADIAGANNFYNPLTQFLAGFGPDKPVMIAPSGTPIVSTPVLQDTEADVLAYQDAVGAGYRPYEYTFDPEVRIAMLDEIYAEYRAAHEGSDRHFWADLEVWQMDGPAYSGAYPADFSRVLRQIQIEAAYVEQITAYAFPGFMADPNSSLRLGGDRAVELYEDYLSYYDTALAARREVRWEEAPGEVELRGRHARVVVSFRLEDGHGQVLTGREDVEVVLRLDDEAERARLRFNPRSQTYTATAMLRDVEAGLAGIQVLASGEPVGSAAVEVTARDRG